MLFRGINISAESGKTIGLDKLSTPVSGHIINYAINSTYSFTSATVTLSYNGANYSNEGYLHIYRCADWDFNGQSCNVDFAEISATQNSSGDYFTFDVTGFSGFGMGEVIPSVSAAEEEEEDRVSRVSDWI